MKIAVVTDDGKTISQHFGRALQYSVYTLEKGKVINKELRDKLGHKDFAKEEEGRQHHGHGDSRGRGYGTHSKGKHRRMFTTIEDCDVLLARGMGRGAYLGLEEFGIKPILTDIAEIELAVQAVMDGSITHYPEKLH